MPLRTNSPMPSLDRVTEWINGSPDLNSLSGTPVLVHFWSTGCHICHENMPTVRRWKEEFGPRGLKLIAFHMPRSEAELDVEEVKRQLGELGIDEPCGIDNEHGEADAFENRFVPAYFLFDQEGKLRARTAGDAGLTNLKSSLDRLFAPPEE